MCLSPPKAPTITQVAAPPPAEAPSPLALPDGEAMSLAALRIGGRNMLRTRSGPPGASGSGSSGDSSGGSSGGSSGNSTSGGSSGASGRGGIGGNFSVPAR